MLITFSGDIGAYTSNAYQNWVIIWKVIDGKSWTNKIGGDGSWLNENIKVWFSRLRIPMYCMRSVLKVFIIKKNWFFTNNNMYNLLENRAEIV